MKKIVGLLATAAVLGLNVTPAFAGGGNDGTVQSQSQTSIITGDGNATYQRSVQRSSNVRRGRTGGDAATIQTSDQFSDVFGNDNISIMEAEQNSRNERQRRRR